jgi:hypothetical protein
MISASTYDSEGQLRFRQIYQHHVKTYLVEKITRVDHRTSVQKVEMMSAMFTYKLTGLFLSIAFGGYVILVGAQKPV